MENDILTAEEAAKALRISLVTARHLLATGQLQGRKLGKSWRIHPDALRAFLMNGEHDATQCQGNCKSIPCPKGK
jgi:excisionase family DNA binding protein